jgi:hypothetical protein
MTFSNASLNKIKALILPVDQIEAKKALGVAPSSDERKPDFDTVPLDSTDRERLGRIGNDLDVESRNRDTTLGRHIYDLHAIREHYDASPYLTQKAGSYVHPSASTSLLVVVAWRTLNRS